MLWLDKDVKLPSNLYMMLRRFNLLRKRLQGDSTLQKKYEEIRRAYIKNRYARKPSKVEASKVSNRTWYLPHHPVLNVNKSNKIWVLFDPASRFDGMSLNKTLLTGLDLLSNLIGILLEFRNHKVVIVTLYHHLKVPQHDTDSIRFFWQEDVNMATQKFVRCLSTSLVERIHYVVPTTF